MKLLVLPGDGIGPEITAAALPALRAVSQRFDLGIDVAQDLVGHDSLRKHGTTVRPELLELARRADGLVLGPTAAFEFPGEINPSMFFRKKLDLYANIRPSRTYEGVPTRVGAFDLIVVRENTEGFYADRNMESGGSEMLVTPDLVVSLRRITRKCCERIARAAFELAVGRNKHVTFVHKGNVLKMGDGMFLEECRKVGREFPQVKTDEIIVDAMMAHAVRNPRRFDVIVTTNMFGDILSDLTAELSGSLGLAGSINAGDTHAMAQASHGTAPDIAGKNLANPFSMVLSMALLLDWHGRRQKLKAFTNAAVAIEKAVEAAVAARETTSDIGGKLGTAETGAALAKRLRA
ncbi:MAG: isocitrate/isopropylmalate dehydrogenase family protein [Pseudolabrys sp.]|nr:isocitrate/isopropylmalate dehydrogenase family protein [Pseudolabrys sp.]